MEVNMSELTDALETLIENEILEDGTAAYGIAKQVIADDGTQNLSDRQDVVFTNHITPHLEQECEEEDCLGDGNISLEDLPEAYNQQFELGGLYCEECVFAKFRIKDLVAKED